MGAFAGIIYPHTLGMGHLILPMFEAMAHCHCGTPHTVRFHNFEVGCCDCDSYLDKKSNTIGILDGHIFNRKKLYETLKEEGYQFFSNSDAELLLHAYHYWGIDFLKQLDGEFILFIAEIEKKKFVLARDFLGKKPLYWAHHKDHLLFSTECKAILKTGLIPQAPSMESMAAYLFFGYVPQDMTLVKHINKLLPGYYLECIGNHSLSILPFWSYSSYFTTPSTIPIEEVPEHLDFLLHESVALRYPEKDQPGCFVSGGIGSASIAYYVNRHRTNSHPLTAYTTIFSGQNEEDLQTADIVAKTLGMRHKIKSITPETLTNDLAKILWYLDEPLADPNIVATWHLAELAAQDTPTVFSGMGADELLVGHTRYLLPEAPTTLAHGRKLRIGNCLRHFLLPWLAWFDKNHAFQWMRRLRTNPWQYIYMQQNALFPIPILSQASPLLAKLFDPKVFLNKFYHMERLPNTLSSFLYFDVKTRLADCFMFQYERLSSAQGLLWETPFIDRRIVEFLASLPRPETMRESETAQWLKMLMRPVFPSSVVDRPKRQRPFFLRSWASQEPLLSLFPLLQHGVLVETGIIGESWIAAQLRSKKSMEEAFPYLWAILVLEIWMRLFIHGSLDPKMSPLATKELLQQK